MGMIIVARSHSLQVQAKMTPPLVQRPTIAGRIVFQLQIRKPHLLALIPLDLVRRTRAVMMLVAGSRSRLARARMIPRAKPSTVEKTKCPRRNKLTFHQEATLLVLDRKAHAAQRLAALPNTQRSTAVRERCPYLIRRLFRAILAASARLLAGPIAAQPHVLQTRTSGHLVPSQRRLPRTPCIVEKG